MAASKNRTVPTWSQVKAKLAHFDRAGLVGLLDDLHGLSRDNQAFLHARLGLGADPLSPYKATISPWIYLDLIRGQDGGESEEGYLRLQEGDRVAGRRP